MATKWPDVQSRQLPRNALAELSRSSRTRKALENLLSDVSAVLPDSIDELADLIAAADGAVSAASAQALQALLLVAVALQAATEGPPPAPVIVAAQDEPAGMAALRDRLSVLERAVAQLSEGPTP